MEPTPVAEPCRREIFWSLALLGVAALLRAGILWNYGSLLNEDRDHYRRIGDRIAAGEGYVDPNTGSPTAYRPPLYPVLLALLIFCGGGTAAISVFQLLLGVGTIGLTMACAHRLKLKRAALLAGLLVAVDPLLLYQTALVMTETTAAFLAVLLWWLCLQAPSRIRDFSLGLVFGLACLCRPTFWACGALAVVAWLARQRTARMRTPQTENVSRHSSALLLSGLLLAILPWTIRNTIVMGRPIVTTTHGGYTLLLAHNPAYTQAVVNQPWGSVWEGPAFDSWSAALETELANQAPPLDAAHLTPATELARDRWMNRTAWEYIYGSPVTALKTAGTLLGRFWNVAPLAAGSEGRSPRVRLAIGAFYTALFVLVVAGMIRQPALEWRSWLPGFVLIAGFTAVHLLYWADMRMRTPLVPALALIAARNFARPGARLAPERDS